MAAAGVAAAAAAALFAGSAAGVSVRLLAPDALTQVYPPAAGSTVVLSWRTDLSGCPNPLSQTVAVTPRSGQSIINLIGATPVPATGKHRQAIRILGAVTRRQRYTWSVTLVCASGRAFTTSRRSLILWPPGPKLQGTYAFFRPVVGVSINRGRLLRAFGGSGTFRANTVCRGIRCSARVIVGGVPLRLRSQGNVSPVNYKGGGTGRVNCTDRRGNVVVRGLRITITITRAQVQVTAIRNRMTIAQESQFQGRQINRPTTGNRSGGCQQRAFNFNTGPQLGG